MICRGRYPMLISNAKFQAWNEEQLWLLKSSRPLQPLENVNVDIILIAPDNRSGDLSNKVESLMDLLVEAQYLKDDNWFVVPELNIHFGGVDKDNPKAIIEITKR